MFRKCFALLLAVMLIAANVVPVAHAAGNDPLVLHIQSSLEGAPLRHYYLKDGTPARSEQIDNSKTYTAYTYSGQVLRLKQEYYNGKLTRMTSYDQYGTQIDETRYEENGQVQLQLVSEPTYDKLGRLVQFRQWDQKDPQLVVYTERYEYHEDPTILLGQYEQDGDLTNGPEPIEWMVLGAEGENVLLVSKYALDSRPYHKDSKSVNWETSDVRTWLNESFYTSAFSGSPTSYLNYYNSIFTLSEAPKNKVTDRVFLLSQEEVIWYLPTEADRSCTPTTYATAQNAASKNADGVNRWLLRSAYGSDNLIVGFAADGTSHSYLSDSDSGLQGLIRPAMWVNKTVFYGSQLPVSRKHVSSVFTDPDTNQVDYNVAELYTYDRAGNLTCFQDYRTGEMERWEYDSYGNPTRWLYTTRFDDHHAEATYENRYSASGLLLEQKMTRQLFTGESKGEAPAKTESSKEAYTYDKAGRLTDVRYTDVAGNTGTKSYRYDAQGNLLSITMNGAIYAQYIPLSQALAK